MPVRDPSAVIMAVPDNNMDQIVGVATGSLSATASGTGVDVVSSTTLSSGLGVGLFSLGLWSVDGGTTWYNFGAALYNGNNATTGRLRLTVGVGVDPSGVITVTATNSTTTTYSVDVKIALIAKPGEPPFTPITPTNQALTYRSKNNYMKIAVQDSQTGQSPATKTISHNLNYIPNVLHYITTFVSGVASSTGQAGGVSCVITTSTVTLVAFSSGVLSETDYARVYIDG